MSNKQILFADRLVGLSVQGPTARLDFGVIASTGKGKDGKPATKIDIVHQLVMPLDAFVQAVAVQDKVVKELLARDKKRREAKASAPVVEKPL